MPRTRTNEKPGPRSAGIGRFPLYTFRLIPGQRCPHCGGLLEPRGVPADYICPGCGRLRPNCKYTEIDDGR